MITIPRIALFRPADTEVEEIDLLLKRHEYSVRRVVSVAEVVNLVKEESAPFDVALIPLRMQGGLNAASICLQIRSHQELGSLPVLALTPLKDKNLLQTLYSSGADVVLTAPHDADQVYFQITALARQKLAFEQEIKLRLASSGLRSSTMQALNCVREGILVFNSAEELMFHNRSASLLLGIEERTNKEAVSKVIKEINRLAFSPINSSKPYFESQLNRADGQIFPAFLQVVALSHDGKQRSGVAVAFSDRSEIDQLKSRLTQAERMSSLCLLAMSTCLDFQRSLKNTLPLLELFQQGNKTEPDSGICELNSCLTVLLDVLDVAFDPGVTIKIVLPQSYQVSLKRSDLLTMLGHMLLFAVGFAGIGGNVTVEALKQEEDATAEKQVKLVIAAESRRVTPFLPHDPLSEMLQGASTDPQTQQGQKLNFGLMAAQQIAERYGLVLEYQDSQSNIKTRIKLPVISK